MWDGEHWLEVDGDSVGILEGFSPHGSAVAISDGDRLLQDVGVRLRRVVLRAHKGQHRGRAHVDVPFFPGNRPVRGITVRVRQQPLNQDIVRLLSRFHRHSPCMNL